MNTISVSEAHSYECNEWAVHHSLKRCDLDLPPIPNFEEFLFAEENAIDWQLPTIESGILHSRFRFISSSGQQTSEEEARVQSGRSAYCFSESRNSAACLTNDSLN
jgi:hypothetical protein